MDNKSACMGFTLAELLVVMAIGAVLLMLAVPVFSSLLGTIKLNAAANTYFSHLSLARSEAIKRNARVVLCKSSQGSSCDLAGGWEQGWIVFHDVNGNAVLDQGETVVMRQGALPMPVRFFGNSHISNYVSYTGMGNTKFISSDAFQAGTFTICMESTTKVDARQIVINNTGKVRTIKTVVPHCP